MIWQLHITLRSDTTFGTGQAVAGFVDTEVEYDAFGMPFVRGRTVKGLMVEECSNILYSLQQASHPAYATFIAAADRLFGHAGSTMDDAGILRIGTARMPDDVRRAVELACRAGQLQPTEVLEALTAMRVQTAVNPRTGAPEKGSLRSMRVIVRGLTLAADLQFAAAPAESERALLAACTYAMCRGGAGRNRGRGRLTARLFSGESDITEQEFAGFRQAIEEARALESDYLSH